MAGRFYIEGCSMVLFLITSCRFPCIVMYFALYLHYKLAKMKYDIDYNQSRRTAEEELRLYVRPVRTQQQRGAQPVHEGGRAGTSYSF